MCLFEGAERCWQSPSSLLPLVVTQLPTTKASDTIDNHPTNRQFFLLRPQRIYEFHLSFHRLPLRCRSSSSKIYRPYTSYMNKRAKNIPTALSDRQRPRISSKSFSQPLYPLSTPSRPPSMMQRQPSSEPPSLSPLRERSRQRKHLHEGGITT